MRGELRLDIANNLLADLDPAPLHAGGRLDVVDWIGKHLKAKLENLNTWLNSLPHWILTSGKWFGCVGNAAMLLSPVYYTGYNAV
jgi:hypothetical protein